MKIIAPRSNYLAARLIAASVASIFVASSLSANATAYYWNSTGTSTWATGTSWSTATTGTAGTGAGPTSSSDNANFNGSSFNGNTTAQLAGAQTTGTITIGNTGTTTIDSSSSTAQTLTLGSGGLVVSTGAGAVTIGNSTNTLNVALSAGQSWSNATANTVTVVNGITSTGTSGTRALVLSGAGTGGFTLNGVIGNGGLGGTISLQDNSSGTSTLSAANTYTGGTWLSTGTLVANVADTGSGTSATAGALGAGGIISFRGGTLQFTSNSSGTTADYSSRIINSSNAISVNTNGQNVTFASALADSNFGGLTKSGTGTLSLNAANNYSGTTTINASGGAVQLGNTLAAQNSTVSIGTTNGLTFATGITSFTIGGLSGNSAEALTNNGSANVALTVGNNTLAASYGGALSGGGSLIKVGSGTQTLSSTNTYTGVTTVNNGTLNITGSTGSSAVGVAGGYLAGTGTVNGAVTVSSTGGINLANGATGTLTLASTLSITGAAGANNLQFDLANGSAATDVLKVSGTPSVTNAGAAVIGLNQIGGVGSTVTAGTYSLIQGTSTASAANFALATSKAFHENFTLGASGNNITVTVGAGSAGDVTSNEYWLGSTSAWNTAQWYSNLAGTTTANTPGYNSNVVFAATGASNLATTLGADYEINSLTVNSGVGATSIGGSKTLTIDATSANSNTAGNGITVNNTAGTTISSKVGLVSNQTWTVGSGASLAVSGVITDFGGAYGLTKAGPGNLTLSAANTYTGATTLTTGTLTLTNANALANSPLTINPASSGATATLNLFSDTNTTFNTGLNTSVPSGAYGGSGSNYGIVVNTGLNTFANINVDNTGNSTTGNTLTVGNVLLTNPSPFTTQPTAPNANTGLVVTNAHGYNLNIGTLTRIGQNTAAIEVTNNMVNGTLSISNIVDYETNNGFYWFLGNTASGLTKIGSYAYNTNQDDTIQIDSAGTVLFTGATASFFNGTSYVTPSIVVGQGTAEYATENSLMNNNVTGGWTAGTDTLGGNGGSTNKITIKSGATLALYVGGTAGGGSGTFSAADVAILAQVAGNTSGGILGLDTTSGNFSYGTSTPLTTVGMGLSKLGANTLTLGGANTYTGVTSVINGTLSVGNIVVSGGSSNIGNASSAVVLGGVTGGVGNTAGILNYTGGAASYTRGFTVAGAGGEIDNTGSGLLSISGNITGTGPLTIGGTNSVSISSNITTSGTTTSGSSATVLPSSLTDNNAGTLTLSGTGNTYSGGTTVNAGSLVLFGTASIGSGPLAVNNPNTGAGTAVSLAMGSSNQSVGSLSGAIATPSSGSNTATINNNGHLLTVSQTTGATYAGTISGSGGFTLGLSSTAALNLTAAQSYTGATTINGGTLSLAAGASLAGTATTINSTGTLQVGTIGSTGAVTIGSSGVASLTLSSGGFLNFANGLASSSAVDNLNINSATSGATVLTLNGGTINIGVGGSGGSDQIALGSGLKATIGGSTTIDLYVLTALDGTSQQLISWNGVPTGAGSFALGTVGGAGRGIYTLSLSETSSGLFLNEAATSSAYWTGTSGSSWSTLNNFSTDSGGTTARTSALDNLTSVYFNATANVVNPSSNTTLDSNPTVDNVTFNVGGVVINSDSTNSLGNTLTLNSGMTVASGLGAVTETVNSNVALSASQTWTVGGTATGDSNEKLVVNGNISDGSSGYGLNKAGNGTLVLAGSNTYLGATQVIGGNLNIQSADALDGTSSVTVSSGAALQLQGGYTTFNQIPLTLNGTGMGTAGSLENVSGSNTYTGPVTLASASSIGADVSGDVLTLTGSTVNNGGFTLTLVGAGNGAISSPISGAGGLIMNGTGTWVLDGASLFSHNSYTGTTTVNSGTLQLASSGFGTLGNGSSNNVVVNGGILDLNGNTQIIGGLTGTGGTVTSSTGSSAYLKLTSSSNGTYSGSITGALKFWQFGTGTTTLSGSNSYTGATQIDKGAVNITNSSALGTGVGARTSGVTVASGAGLLLTGGVTPATVPISLNGTGTGTSGVLESVSGSNTINGAITLAGDSTIGVDAGTLNLSSTAALSGSGKNLTLVGAGNFNLADNIGTGAGSVTMNGSGNLTLSGTSSYSGGTIINSGTLFYGSASNLGSGALTISPASTTTTVDYTGTGGTVSNNLNFSGSPTIILGNTGTGAVVYSGTTNFGAGGETVILGNTAGTDTYGGSIGSIGGTLLEKVGNNTWNLTGSTNSVNGQVLIYGGVLQIANASALPSGYLTMQGGILQVQGGGTFARTIGSNYNWFGSAGFAAIGGNLTLNINSGAQLAFSNVGTNQIGNSAGSGVISFGSSTSDSQVILPNAINLNTTDTTEQNIYVTQGTGTDSVLLSGVLSNGTGSTAASGLNKIGNGTLILSNSANSYSGYTSVIGGTLVAEANSPAAGPSTTGVFGSGDGPSGAPSTSYATITLGSASGVAFSNQGGVINPTLMIGGSYTVTNPVSVNWTNGTGQTFGVGGYLGSGSNATFSGLITLNGTAATGNTFAVTQASGGTLNLTGGITATSGGNVNFANVGAVNVSTTGISGTGVSVTQSGTGTTTLSAANTYNGATQVNGGILSVTGSLASGSTVTVGGASASGTPTLNGTGTISGNVIVASAGGGVAGTIASGTASTPYGTLNVGGTISFQVGSVLALNVSGSSSAGELVIGGAATIASGAEISINVGTSLTGSSYVLATAASGLNSGTPFTVLGSLPSGYALVYTGTALDLNKTITNGQYTLTTTAASLNVHINGTTTLTTVLANTGTSPQDTLNSSSIAAAVSGGGSVGSASGTTSATALADGSNTSPGATQTYTAGATAGNVTVTNSGTTVTNTSFVGTPTATNTGATINVYSGLSTWATNGNGSWGTLASGFGTNWGANQGSPGVDSGFTNTDTATFGSALTSGTGTVTLDGASPSVKAITFNNATHSYTIAQGTGGTLKLNGSPATITDSAGNHTISAPVELDSNATSTVSNSGDTMTISGLVSESGGSRTLGVNGPGTTVLSNSGNTFSGAVAVNSGTLAFSTGNASATAAQSLGENTGLTLGVASTSSGVLDYTGGTGTLAKNISALGNGFDTIENTGTGLLTLSGTLTKNGTKLTLNGGSSGIKVSGQITGTSAGSDLIISSGTTTLTNTSNNYNGPTYVQGGGTLVDNTTGAGAALPTSTTLYVGGSDNTTGTVDLGGNSQTIAGLNSQGTGGASNVITNNGSANSTLTVSGGGTFAGLIKNGTSNNIGIAVSGGAMTLTGNNTYGGGTAVSSGTLYVNNAGGASYTAPITSSPHATITATNSTSSGTGTGAVTVSSGGTLAGSGTIAPSSGGVTISSGGTLSSGALQTANAYANSGSGSVSGSGLTINNSSNLSGALLVNGGATLSFALGSTTAYNGGSGALNFANPNTNSTYLSLTGSTVDQIFGNTTTADKINLVDLTNGSPGVSLTLRSQNPYLLIQTALGDNSDFANLWTTGGEGQNGYVLGVSTGVGNNFTAFTLNAYDINGNLVSSSTNLQNLRLYLYNGDLEVVPEPGTWALMVGGLALLIVIQRRRNKQG